MVEDYTEHELEILSMLGEGFHTAFRKAIDCDEAMKIHKLIKEMSNDEWGGVLMFVYDGMKDYFKGEE